MAELLVTAITLYEGLIILRAVISWFTSTNTTHPATDLLRKVTDPVLEPVRKALPETSGIDLSPLVALIGLELLKRFLS
jgi:YggT family protein